MDKTKWAFYVWMTLFVLLWGVCCLLLYFFLLKPDPPQPTPQKDQSAKTSDLSNEEKTSDSINQEKDDDPYMVAYTEDDLQQAKQNAELYLRSYYEIEHASPAALVRDIRPYTTEAFANQFLRINRMGTPTPIQKLILLPGAEASERIIQLECTVIFKNQTTASSQLVMVKEGDQWLVGEEKDSSF